MARPRQAADDARTRPARAEVGGTPADDRLTTLLDVTETGEWEWEFDSGDIVWSPSLGPLHGMPRGWRPSGYEDFIALIHPEDRETLDTAARRARAHGRGYELEFRALLPDGTVRWLWTRAEIVPGGDRLVGVTRDVTDRRRAEEDERALARVSQLLLRTPQAEGAFQALCDDLARDTADWCLVQEVRSGTPGAVLAAAHRRPELSPLLWGVHERDLDDGTGADPRQAVIDSRVTGRATLFDLGSELVVPVLDSRASVTALLVLGTRAGGRTLDARDIALAEAIARRIAVALVANEQLAAKQVAAGRTQALQRVTAQLSAAATAADVLRVAIDHGLAVIGASGGSIAYPVPGSSLMRRVTAGYAPEDAVGRWETVSVEADLPGPEAARTGRAAWLTDRDAAERTFPLLAEVFSHTPWASLCALPLPAGEQRGFFVAFFDEVRVFDAEERAFTQAIVTLCAQALDRARLLDEAARARDVSRRLLSVATRLSVAATPEDVGAAIVSAGLDSMGAEAVLVYARAGDVARVVTATGYDERIVADWRAIPLGTAVPPTHVIETGETLVLPSRAEARRRFPLLEGVAPSHRDRPTVLAPIAVGDDPPTGVVCASFAEGRAVSDDDVAFVRSVARLAAQALERSRLLEAERVTSERLARLQIVTALLGTAMTVDDVARIVVDEGVAALQAAAGALVLQRGGMLETVRAVGYGEGVLDLYGRFAPTDPLVAARVYREGRPLWVGSLEEMEATYPADELALDPHLQAEAYVPLHAGGVALGVLLLGFEGPRTLAEEERQLLLTLSRQCAQAVANARLFEREHRIAEELQQALLPRSVSGAGSLSVAVRYLSGSTEADVGGDWYDVALRPDGRLGGSVGDVAGKGVLAASRMGQLRTAQRAYSLDGHPPAAVVSRLNALVEATDSFLATTVAFDVDPESGELRYCVAGHPPPALRRASGECTLLQATSVPVGVADDVEFSEASVVLEDGDVVVLYTDGLVERPDRPIDEGLELLRAAVGEHGGESPEELVEHLLEALTAAGPLRDDVVLLAVARDASGTGDQPAAGPASA
jgi:serine phosphatase RsbU (regulator of sigma subunit)